MKASRKTVTLQAPLHSQEDGGIDRLVALVLEDTPHMAGIICGILKSTGVTRIHQARTGADALHILANYPVHVAIIDDLEPPLDGLAVIREVRTASARLPNALPVILVTTKAEKSAVFAARDAGATEVLSKPFSAAQLITRVKSVLKNPRPFIKSEEFAGPDRRRRTKPVDEKKRNADLQ